MKDISGQLEDRALPSMTELCSYLAAQSRALERIAYEFSTLNLYLGVYLGPEGLEQVRRVLKAQHVEENRED